MGPIPIQRTNMQASDVSQYLKESSKDPENLWLIVAWVVFFPLVLAWALWRAINQGAYAVLSQAAHNEKLKYMQVVRLENARETHRQQMMLEYQQYLADREKRLQAYEKKIRDQVPPPQTTAQLPDAPAP